MPSMGYGKRGLFVIDKKGILRHIDILSENISKCPDISHILKTLQSE